MWYYRGIYPSRLMSPAPFNPRIPIIGAHPYHIMNCNRSLSECVPISDHFTDIIFGCFFNQPLNPGEIPNSVVQVVFGDMFDQKINPGDIPNSVTHLKFGSNFNRPLVKGSIPDSVTHLAFGKYFDQDIKPGDIPDSVIFLVLRNKWTQQSCIYFEDNSLQENILATKINSGILEYIPNELLFYLLEYSFLDDRYFRRYSMLS